MFRLVLIVPVASLPELNVRTISSLLKLDIQKDHHGNNQSRTRTL